MLRGGYGIGYYRVEGNDIYGLVGNPPFANIINVFNPPLDDPSRGSVGADRPKNVVTIDPIYSVPMVQTYSFGVQHQLAINTAITASYVGSRGTHLDRGRQLNFPLPGDGLDFDPRLNTRQIALERLAPFQGWSAIKQRENTASSTYHSLQVDFNRAYKSGLHFQAVYTLSKVIADADGFGAQPQNPRNLEAERALAGFDRTHVAVFNYIYELPFWRSPSNAFQRVFGGWELSGSPSSWSIVASQEVMFLHGEFHLNSKISFSVSLRVFPCLRGEGCVPDQVSRINLVNRPQT